jgi:hypothetical protein
LDRLSPSQAAWYSSAESTSLRRNGCTPNTRVGVLHKLGVWAIDGASEKVYWLNGMAGTGKTTIAYSLCNDLDRACTLVASFFCSRQVPTCRDANLILPTLAYQLARFSPPFRYALSCVMEKSPDVHTRKVSEQFESMILKPLQQVKETMRSDLVVVMDALDECDNDDAVSEILDTLLLHASGLPIKFFVTSRPEITIIERMRSRQGERFPIELRLHDLEESIVSEDIRTYLKAKLEHTRLSSTDLEALVAQSGVLFIWAATVVRFVGGHRSLRSSQRMKQVLDVTTSTSTKGHKAIDELYSAILKAALDNEELQDQEREEMKVALYTAVCAQEPLTAIIIASLLNVDETSVHASLRPLLSVLHVSETSGLVTTLHASFPDYLFDEQRSEKYFCDRRQSNGHIAQQCFHTMRIPDPPFNICNLSSSYLFDKAIPDLDLRIEASISAVFFYACRYWGAHLELSEASQVLEAALYEFLSTRLLLWMEVLNLKQCLDMGARYLPLVQRWTQVGFQTNSIALWY